ncbi:52 kda repressor of the inhibitor of the protein kinase-like protein [Lasius niger]|uniref:52 kDa repressor of the inhibitor of the protein kinase-like protein n=1 Tax=Lasius niger TaxID=67767 RepID=A0A0J7NNB2_LASNI|nr:52 kda repressor of the inhibitor of the protein kinase-like protein [Lasius niger]
MSDIRRFLCKKRKTDDTTATPSSSTDHQKEDGRDEESPLNSGANLLDIGLYLDSNSHADDELRLKLLREPWAPSQMYNFKKDVNIGAKRAFRSEWLTTYPWLTYSAIAKGPLCRVCVLFRPPAQRGLQGQFIVSPCLKYHKFHEAAQSHATTQWHRNAIVSSKNFEKIMDRQQLSVHEALDSAYHKEVEENRVKLRSIISTILFCGQHDLPVRGKSDEGSVFRDLLHFRIESGDKVLKNHLESGAKNSLYISHQIQNDLIQTYSDVLKGKIIEEVKRASVFSVLADETADISGTEQLSIGVRYLRCDQKNKKPIICEEFLGFVPLQELNSKSISETIIRFLENCDLDLNRLVGQGYDGCAAMAGHISGVQKLINDKYPMALFFHCASHILNLVINDLNDVNEVRNTAGTTKEIINFFRESTLRRNMIPNIPLFCETRWSAKYKSIRIFSENFSTIVRALKELSENAPNSKTKVNAHQLYTTATTPTYIVTLLVIAIYSAKLEPVCNQLQQVNMNIKAINDHVAKLTNVPQSHRNNALIQFTAIFEKAQKICEELDIEFKRPRVAARQTQRSNQPSENVEDFFRRSIFIPYLDSIISSLRDRFSSTHEKAFSLMQLHPDALKKLDKVSFLAVAEDINSLYGDILSNFIAEATTWYEMWKNEATPNESLEYADLICQATPFYPAVAEAIKIGLTLPATTCSIERSFSTLRRIKTWNRSTMGDKRLSGLCMLSVHRKRVQEDTEFIDNVTNEFGK